LQVTTADLALVLGITERRIQQLEKPGVFRRLGHGEWDLADSVQSYLRHRLQSEIRRRRPPSRGNADEKLKTAKAAREELKLGLEERTLMPTEEAIAVLDDIVGTIRADMAGVPARLTRDMALRGRMETEIDAVFGRAADSFERQESTLRPRGDPDPAAAADEP
jgi:phage terminase Nu1 subunit (DNA packaging protein)